MTPYEIQEWLNYLAPTPAERLKVLRDLIRYAAEDEMSAEDRSICVNSFCSLKKQLEVVHDS